MKILYKPSIDTKGGVYNYIFNLLEYIDYNNNKYSFDILTKNHDVEKLDLIKSYQCGIKYYTQSELSLLKKEMEKILGEGYDVFHLHVSFWAGLLMEEVAMQMGIKKVIVHAHSSFLEEADDTLRAKRLKIHEYYRNHIDSTYATHFCACSRKAADWLFGSQIPRENIHIMHNAINIEKFSYNQIKRKRIRDRLGFGECFVLGYTARFAYVKNHNFLIKVFYKAFQKNDKLRLLLLGDGPLEEDIKNLVRESGLEKTVIFAGWQENVEDFLQGMDMYVMPSLFEGLPVCLIEAQTAGLKCIVADTVTDEVKITENLRFLPLEEKRWVEEILKMAGGYERKKMDDEIRKAGYDMQEEIKNMEKLYSE